MSVQKQEQELKKGRSPPLCGHGTVGLRGKLTCSTGGGGSRMEEGQTKEGERWNGKGEQHERK